MPKMQVATIDYVSPEELEEVVSRLVGPEELARSLQEHPTRAEVATAIASAVTSAVAPLASKTELEAARRAAVTEATAGRPNWTETNARLRDLLEPILRRLAALEARLP